MTAPSEAARKRRFARTRAFRSWVRGLPGGRLVWRLVVTVIGVAIVVVGILLLPLPGPGWLIIFAGLGLLATEYTWASRLLAYLRNTLRRWSQWLSARSLWVRLLAGLLSLAFLAGIALAAWYIAHGGSL